MEHGSPTEKVEQCILGILGDYCSCVCLESSQPPGILSWVGAGRGTGSLR